MSRRNIMTSSSMKRFLSSYTTASLSQYMNNLKSTMSCSHLRISYKIVIIFLVLMCKNLIRVEYRWLNIVWEESLKSFKMWSSKLKLSDAFVYMWSSRRYFLSNLMSFHRNKKWYHHWRFSFIFLIIWWREISDFNTSKRRRKKTRSEIIIFAANERNSIKDCKFECKIKFFFRAELTASRVFFNFFSNNLTFIFRLSSSIFRNSTVVKHTFFFSLTLTLNSIHKASNSDSYRAVSIFEFKITKKSFR